MNGKTKPKVLYIDDESINLTLFNLSFNKDYNIKLFTSSDEALKSISESYYEVIISDQRISLMNGALFMVKAKKISSNSKFILIIDSISWVLTVYLIIIFMFKGSNKKNKYGSPIKL